VSNRVRVVVAAGQSVGHAGSNFCASSRNFRRKHHQHSTFRRNLCRTSVFLAQSGWTEPADIPLAVAAFGLVVVGGV